MQPSSGQALAPVQRQCLLVLLLAAAAAAATAPPQQQQAQLLATDAATPQQQQQLLRQPSPPVWPQRFRATLFQNHTNKLALTTLWYSWPDGANLNIIASQLGGTVYDLEFNNGTSFIFSRDEPACKTLTFDVRRAWQLAVCMRARAAAAHAPAWLSCLHCAILDVMLVPPAVCPACRLSRLLSRQVGILYPSWLANSSYLGQTSTDTFVTDVWTKAGAWVGGGGGGGGGGRCAALGAEIHACVAGTQLTCRCARRCAVCCCAVCCRLPPTNHAAAAARLHHLLRRRRDGPARTLDVPVERRRVPRALV